MHKLSVLRKGSISFKILAVFIASGVLLAGISTLIMRTPALQTSSAYASALPYMSAPTKLIDASVAFDAPILRGIKVFGDDPFKFEFIVDAGNSNFGKEKLKEESNTLIRYFLAALTMPEDDLWVNLSPHEKDRVIPETLAQTDMGADMLGEDYVLKQLTASLTYPENKIGKQYWQKIYAKASELFGTIKIPIDTFNKVWIVPQSATIYEDDDKAIITESYLKVMSEQDYLAMENQSHLRQSPKASAGQKEKIHEITSEILKEEVLPEIERDVNYGKNFSHLRQVYHSLLLATWFKQKLKEHIVTQLSADQKKIDSIKHNDPELKNKIYDQYLQAYKKGVYDYIKKDFDPSSKKHINRRYYSGGVKFAKKTGNVVKKGRQPLAGKSGKVAEKLKKNPLTNLAVVLVAGGLEIACASTPKNMAKIEPLPLSEETHIEQEVVYEDNNQRGAVIFTSPIMIIKANLKGTAEELMEDIKKNEALSDKQKEIILENLKKLGKNEVKITWTQGSEGVLDESIAIEEESKPGFFLFHIVLVTINADFRDTAEELMDTVEKNEALSDEQKKRILSQLAWYRGRQVKVTWTQDSEGVSDESISIEPVENDGASGSEGTKAMEKMLNDNLQGLFVPGADGSITIHHNDKTIEEYIQDFQELLEGLGITDVTVTPEMAIRFIDGHETAHLIFELIGFEHNEKLADIFAISWALGRNKIPPQHEERISALEAQINIHLSQNGLSLISDLWEYLQNQNLSDNKDPYELDKIIKQRFGVDIIVKSSTPAEMAETKERLRAAGQQAYTMSMPRRDFLKKLGGGIAGTATLALAGYTIKESLALPSDPKKAIIEIFKGSIGIDNRYIFYDESTEAKLMELINDVPGGLDLLYQIVRGEETDYENYLRHNPVGLAQIIGPGKDVYRRPIYEKDDRKREFAILYISAALAKTQKKSLPNDVGAVVTSTLSHGLGNQSKNFGLNSAQGLKAIGWQPETREEEVRYLLASDDAYSIIRGGSEDIAIALSHLLRGKHGGSDTLDSAKKVLPQAIQYVIDNNNGADKVIEALCALLSAQNIHNLLAQKEVIDGLTAIALASDNYNNSPINAAFEKATDARFKDGATHAHRAQGYRFAYSHEYLESIPQAAGIMKSHPNGNKALAKTILRQMQVIAKPLMLGGKSFGWMVENLATGKQTIYTSDEELEDQIPELAKRLNKDPKEIDLNFAKRFRDGHETFHAFIRHLRQEGHDLSGIDNDEEERLSDLFGESLAQGSAEAPWDLKDELEDLGLISNIALALLIENSSETLEEMLKTLNMADVEVISTTSDALEGIKQEYGQDSNYQGERDTLGGVDLTDRGNITVKGKGLKVFHTYKASEQTIKDFPGFGYKILGSKEITDLFKKLSM
ncbi:MAG: hypothetical protein GY858_05880 [Candidatus Omnitrophica bacterium]|nr:hypothetical protein [Candidatus Omnitrophota bacterium]